MRQVRRQRAVLDFSGVVREVWRDFSARLNHEIPTKFGKMRVMKISFQMRILVFLVALSTPLVAVSFAQTSIYKAPVSGPSSGTQRVALTYRAIFDIPAPVSGEVIVTVPFPADDEFQSVEKYSFGSAMPPEKLFSVSLQRDAVYGNRALEIRVLNPAPGDELVFEYEISRKEKSNSLDAPIKVGAKISMPEKQFLTADNNPTRADKNAALASEIVTKKMSGDEAIRAIYRYSIDQFEADTKEVRSEHRDTFIARAAGIPAKPETGVLIPAGKDEGEISKAHAWTNLFHQKRGWIPVDVAEGAAKKRYVDYYLGNISSDHISFAVGDSAVLEPYARKFVLSNRSDISPVENIPMKMKIFFKRLPNSNPMITANQSSGVE